MEKFAAQLQKMQEEVRRLSERLERHIETPRIERFIVAVNYREGDVIVGEKTEGPSYTIGDVGSGARVAQGMQISWVEGFSGLPDGEKLKQQFEVLIHKIAQDSSLDDDARELALSKTEAIAEGIVHAKTSPGGLRRALVDAKSWFGGKASWIGRGLADVLGSEPARKALGVVTEAATKAAIDAFTSEL